MWMDTVEKSTGLALQPDTRFACSATLATASL